MTSPGPFFGPVGTRAESAPAPSLRLTKRAEVCIYVLAFALGFLSVPLGVWWT